MAFSKLNSIVAFALVLTVFEGCLVRALTPTMAPSMAPTRVPAPSVPPTTALAPSVPPTTALAPSVPPTTELAPSMPPTTAMAPGPSPDCFSVLLNVSDCLSYVEEGSNETVPAKGCCGELAGLVESSPICLCRLLSDPSQSGFSIEVSKALNLPSVCGVPTPPVSTCAVFGYPVAGPAEAPAPGGNQPLQESPSPAPPSGGSSSVFERKPFAYLLLCLAFASLPIV